MEGRMYQCYNTQITVYELKRSQNTHQNTNEKRNVFFVCSNRCADMVLQATCQPGWYTEWTWILGS